MRGDPRSATPPDDELARRVARRPLLVALDIDGTLAPLAPTPEAAAIPHGTNASVRALVERADTTVAIVTGRAARDAQRLVPVEGVWIVGNHGIERIAPDGTMTVDPRVAPHAPAIADAATALAALTSELRGVFVENKQWTLSVHYRLADRDAIPAIERMVTELSDALDLRIVRGKEIFELRPPVDVHKGTAVERLGRQVGAIPRGAVFYAGDDRTDEDAFGLLRAEGSRAATVRVGGGDVPTAAEWYVTDVESMAVLLAWLAALPGAPR